MKTRSFYNVRKVYQGPEEKTEKERGEEKETKGKLKT